MAEVITRFKLETTQYDSKLRDAAKGLSELTRQLSIAGKDFDKFAKDHVKAAQSLATVESGATNLKDRLKDLVGAYNEAAKAYNNLTNDQKNGEFGKALAGSLQTLQARITETKDKLYNLGGESDKTSGFMDKLAGRFTLSFDAVKMFNIGVQAAEKALQVLKDAFFQSESNIDEWGRTVEGAKGAYSLFLNTLNSGNWNNFFTNLSTAVQGARDLYDALDRLGSVKANNQAAIAIQQEQVARLRLMKQQGQNVDEQLKAATERLAQLQRQSVEAGKTAGHKTIVETLRNRIMGANTTGVNISEGTLRGVAGAIENRGQEYVDLMTKKKLQLEQKGMKNVVKYDSLTRSYYETRVFNLAKLTKSEQQQYLIAQAVKEGETEIQKGISIYAQAVGEGAAAAREEFKGNRYALQGSSGSGKGKKGGGTKSAPKETITTVNGGTIGDFVVTGNVMPSITNSLRNAPVNTASIDDYIRQLQGALRTADLGSELYTNLTSKLQDASMMQSVLQQALASGASAVDMSSIAQEIKAKMLEGDIDEAAWQEFLDKINENIADADLKLVFDVDTKTVTTAVQQQKKETAEMAKEWQAAGTAIQAVGSAMSQIEDPAAKVLGTIAQAVATMALSYSQAALATAPSGWGWIAFAATGLATMISSISAIKQATSGFANGGVIPGNSMSGDNLRGMTPDGTIYGLNSQEIILNRAQQGNLAAQLEGGGIDNLQLETKVGAEDLIFVLNNNASRRGFGEFIDD